MTKKLVHENILQEYIFEKLTFSKSNERKKFLPHFLNNKEIKIIIPEFNKRKHRVDFLIILKNGSEINLEVEWTTSKFNHDFRHYVNKKGYIIVLHNDIDNIKEKNLVKYNKLKEIDIININNECFKQWFILNSDRILSETMSSYHPDIKIRESPKYWVIYISNDESQKHFVNIGKKSGKWAFRFKREMKNVMNILKGDYVIFVSKHNQKKARFIYAGYKDWGFKHINIYEVTKNYYCDIKDKCFEKNNYVNRENREFMHFFKFNRNSNTPFSFVSNSDLIFTGSDFKKTDKEDVEFCDALRYSNTQSGSPQPISNEAFKSLRKKINIKKNI
jgi:hypothetical protein